MSGTLQRTSLTILFTDIEGSTAMNERLGDARWLEVLRRHNAILCACIEELGGRVVKFRGDGYMAVFDDAQSAIDCAVRAQRELLVWGIAAPEERVHVRMGIHSGDVIAESDDFVGRNVTVAARLAERARGGEVLVTAEARDASGVTSFGPEGRVVLPGLAGRHVVVPVSWKPHAPWRHTRRVRVPRAPRDRPYAVIERLLQQDVRN